MPRKNNNTALVSTGGHGEVVRSHVQDSYTVKHSRTTTKVYKDGYSVQQKEISTATHQSSYNSKNSNSVAIPGGSRNATYTHYTTTTHKGPGNERYVESNRDYHSNIQKSSYNPGRGGNGTVARYQNYGGY